MKSVGIDIGTHSIKVLEASANSKGQIRVLNFSHHLLNSSPAFDNELEIIEFLKSVAAQYDPADTKIVLCLKQSQVAVRHKIFPFADRLKIYRSLPFELEEDLPFPPENAVVDAKIIRIQGSNAEVLACATPKVKLEQFIRKYGELGFDISIISAEGLAFANCFEPWFEGPKVEAGKLEIAIDDEPAPPWRDVKVVLNIGHSTTLVCAFDRDRLVGVRSILWGGKNLADAVARRYELPFIEALKEVQSKSFILLNHEGVSPEQIAFSETIELPVRELGRDLKISMIEFQSELNARIESVAITGGAAQVQNLQGLLTQILEVPVNRVSTFQNVMGFERSPLMDASHGLALGLAIEGLKKPRNPAIQFLRNEFAKQNSSAKKFWEDWGRTIQVAIVAYVILFAFSQLREQFSQNLSDRATDALKEQGKSVAKLGKKGNTEAGVKKYIKDQRSRAKELKTISGIAKMNSAMDILKKVTDATPGKPQLMVDVKKLSVTDNVLTIEALLGNPQQVNTFQRSLASVAVDGKVQLINPSINAAPGRTVFSASIKVDRGVQ